MLRKSPMFDRLSPAGVASLYAAFAALWITLSGYLPAITVTDPLLQSRIAPAKELAFVAFTSGLLILLLKRWCASIDGSTTAQTSDTPAPKNGLADAHCIGTARSP